MKLHYFLLAGGAAVLPSVLLLLGHWSVGQPTLPESIGSTLPSLGLFTMVPSFALVAVAIARLSANVRRSHPLPQSYVVVGIGALVGAILLFATAPIGMRLRLVGFGRLAHETEPVVKAIHAYETQRGALPNRLADLVPGYIPQLPKWSDRIRYYRLGDGPLDFHGNSWMLWVDAHWGAGYDSFVYFPNQTYPKHMHGGAPELVGGWAYVHE